MVPIFLQTMELIKDTSSKLSIVIPVAPNQEVETYIAKEIRSWPLSDSVILISGASMNQKFDAFSVCQHPFVIFHPT